MKRRVKFAGVLILPLIVGLLPGCVVTQKVYLNQVEVEGPIATPPITPRMEADPPAVEITPRIAVGGGKSLRGKFTISAPDVYSRSDGQMTWALPSSSYGLDMMLRPGPNFGLGLGMSLSSVSGRSQEVWRFGMQYSNLNNELGIGLDAGLQLSSLRVHARSTVVTEVDGIFGKARYVDYFDDTVQKSGLGGYLALTLNSVFNESRVNIFLNGGVVWQPLLDYSAGIPDPIYGPGDGYTISPNLHESLAFGSVTPGVIFELGNHSRLLFGTRMIFSLDVDNPTPEPIFQPVLQCTFGL